MVSAGCKSARGCDPADVATERVYPYQTRPRPLRVIVFDDRPGTMHTGWKAAGFDCGLSQGDAIGCALHPNVVAA